MAKMRGYILSLDKDIDALEHFSQKHQLIQFQNNCQCLSDFILMNCDKNEGLQKLYSFNTLESMVTKMKKITEQQEDWLFKACKLLIRYLKYPLPVSSCCESVIKKLLAMSNKSQVEGILKIIKSLSSTHEVRAKYTALHIALSHMSVKQYLQENQDSIEEMILLSAEPIIVGKFVTAFFEGLLRQLYTQTSSEGNPQLWFEYWMPAYLKAVNSEDQTVRVSVCQNITPILVKINKLSLAYILSNFLEHSNLDQQNQQLEALMILLRIARQNKMIQICDDTKDLKLQKNLQDQLSSLQEIGVPEFSIKQSDLLKIILTNNWKMSLECFSIVAQETKASSSSKEQKDNENSSNSISEFDYEMCQLFALKCTKTTFPEHRKHFMHSIRIFFTRVRATNLRKIKNYVSQQSNQKCSDLDRLIIFLKYIISFCEQNLYVDKPIEAALPFFEILIMVQQFFGDYDYQLRVNYVLPAVCLLSKENLMESKILIMYLLNCLKSSWALVRFFSFEILSKIPENNAVLNDPEFVNNEVLSTALIFCNNPKAMVAEGSSLLLKFVFKKCLKVLYFIKQDSDVRNMQLQFCQYILNMIQIRIQIFHQTLINEGKPTALLHGLLGFFKNLFIDFKIQKQDLLSQEDFLQWRQFFKDFIDISLKISNLCSGLLGNNRIQDQEGNTKTFDQQIETDCRGHPIFERSIIEGKSECDYEDQENLILVGVWLAEKENGLTLFNMLSWLELPNQDDDQSKFLQDDDIIGLCDNILNLLFTYKHRGAIEKAAESFSLLCSKLLNSNRKKFQNIPLAMLKKALERITKENHSTVLRRSAGIPPTVIAILRAEPLSNEPILLNQTIEFLLDLARNSEDTDDAKIHALNILRFIFQDSLLKNDINKFLTPAMILATENFKSESWPIRNSALMCFTSLTKRLLNTTNVQEQDLSRKKGLSTWEFVSKYSQLSDYFKQTLKQSLQINNKQSKESKERTDMVVFSILLLISRLVPSFQIIDSHNLEDEDDQLNDSEQVETKPKSNEQSIRDFVQLIKAYSQSQTYFVRKISAQALLPIMMFDEYIMEIQDCFNILVNKIDMQKEYKLRQNQAHGLMIRINIFLEAFYKYKSINLQMSTKSEEEEKAIQIQEQLQLFQVFNQFQTRLTQAESTFQLIIVSLYIKTLKLFIEKNHSIDLIKQVTSNFQTKILESLLILTSQNQFNNYQKKTDLQVYLTEITKTYLMLLGKQKFEGIESIKIIQKIVLDIELIKTNTDFVFKFLKALYAQIKQLQGSKEKQLFQDQLSQQLICISLPEIIKMNDEQYCKVLEWNLKIVYRLNKNEMSQSFKDNRDNINQMLSQIINHYQVNPSLTSLYIKLQTLMIDSANPDSLRQIGKTLRKYGYGDQKELVRIATVKSICKIMDKIDILKNVENCLDLIFASLLVLNDENPEVRGYITQSKSVQKSFLDEREYSLKSQSLYKHNQGKNEIVVEVNEVILIEQIIERMGSFEADIEQKQEITNKFLLEDLLMSNPYREQNEKNYDDKIFLFEPTNKYFDLLWLKRIAFKQLLKQNNNEIIDKNKLKDYKQKSEINSNKCMLIEKAQTANVEIGESSLQFENKIENLMLNIISSQNAHIDQISTGSKAYLLSILKE